jgi:hypothetical protein
MPQAFPCPSSLLTFDHLYHEVISPIFQWEIENNSILSIVHEDL